MDVWQGPKYVSVNNAEILVFGVILLTHKFGEPAFAW